MLNTLLAVLYCGSLGCATWVDRSGEAAHEFEVFECEQSCSVYDAKGAADLPDQVHEEERIREGE